MKLVNTLILNREDLHPIHADKEIGEIMYSMFSVVGNGIILHEDLALFVDENGSIKVLKDRSGQLEARKQ